MGRFAGRPAEIRLTVRRFVCGDTTCAVSTSVEQVPGLTMPYARWTNIQDVLAARPAVVGAPR
jgi:hypothetical protein